MATRHYSEEEQGSCEGSKAECGKAGTTGLTLCTHGSLVLCGCAWYRENLPEIRKHLRECVGQD